MDRQLNSVGWLRYWDWGNKGLLVALQQPGWLTDSPSWHVRNAKEKKGCLTWKREKLRTLKGISNTWVGEGLNLFQEIQGNRFWPSVRKGLLRIKFFIPGTSWCQCCYQKTLRLDATLGNSSTGRSRDRKDGSWDRWYLWDFSHVSRLLSQWQWTLASIAQRHLGEDWHLSPSRDVKAIISVDMCGGLKDSTILKEMAQLTPQKRWNKFSLLPFLL